MNEIPESIGGNSRELDSLLDETPFEILEYANVGSAGKKILKHIGDDIPTVFSKIAKSNRGNSNIKITSKTFGKPLETTINGKKVKLRVDAEPDGNKIQIQAGGGKKSTVDVRIDPKLPLEPQVPKQLNLTKGQKQELLKNLQKAVDWLNN